VAKFRVLTVVSVISLMLGAILSTSIAATPVVGAVVTLWGTGSTTSATTNSSGQFSFNILATGRYTLTVRVVEYGAAQAKSIVLSTKLVPGSPVVLVENHNSSRSNKTYPIAQPGGGQISVTVYEASVMLDISTKGATLTGTAEWGTAAPQR